VRNPNVPESLDGWSILHRMFSFNRRRFEALDATNRTRITADALEYLLPLHEDPESDVGLVQLLGHKADLMLTYYARSFDALGDAEIAFDRLALRDYLEPRASYVSILELGLYDATRKMHEALRERKLKPYSAEWNDAFDLLLSEAAEEPRSASRLWAKIPPRRYACFYPMDKKRSGKANWYMLPYEDRAALMVEHGKIGRTFHGLVTQVISGSIGFDDYEWGVDLYADDPLVFKRLIYEMRFDEASAKYGEFGPFYTGMQFSIDALPAFLEGRERAALLTPATA
jgi:hydrogen peroxide-dependent heme synthase